MALLGDFNARVSNAVDVNGVIFNASGKILMSFLNEVQLVICNGRPEWTRLKSSLKEGSVIDYIITDIQLMKESGVCKTR